MILPKQLLLSAATLSSPRKSFVAAFSTTEVGRPPASPSRRRAPVVVVRRARGNEDDETPTGEGRRNATTNDPPPPSSSSREKAAIVFLHGLGDSPDGWSRIAEYLPDMRPSLAELDITYVFPPANMVGITVNGGEKMPGWFDVFDWPIGVDAKDDPKGLAMSVKRVEKIVTQLREEEGIDPSRVVLGGFSQGGAVALTASYNRRKRDAVPFAGCVCMSGWLPMKDYLDVSEESAASTPLFWAHGQYDDKIPHEQQMFGVNKLEGAGVDVTACSYPVGHESSNYEEIDDMAGFLESVLCPRPRTGRKPRRVRVDEYDNEGGEGAAGSGATDDDDETNALLYYLCAMGIEGSIPVDDSVPSAAAAP